MENTLKLTLVLALASSCGSVDGFSSEDLYGLSSQPRSWLSGLVTSRRGASVSGAAVQVEGVSTRSTADGAYRLELNLVTEVAAGSASADGFAPYDFVLPLKSGANGFDIALTPLTCADAACPGGQVCGENSSPASVRSDITLRIVAGDRSMPEALDSVREPTGWPSAI